MLDQQVLQVTHDMANLIQELIAITESDAVEMKKIQNSLSRGSMLLRLYTLIYRNAPLEECLEQIQIYSNRTIECDAESWPKNPSIIRLVAFYCFWLTKYTDIILKISLNQIEIEPQEDLRELSIIQKGILQEISAGITINITSKRIMIEY